MCSECVSGFLLQLKNKVQIKDSLYNLFEHINTASNKEANL